MFEAGVRAYSEMYYEPGYEPAETARVTPRERYRARVHGSEPIPGQDGQWLAYVAYPLDLFEEGSVASVAASIAGNVFGFKALRALRLEDLRFPVAYVKTFAGPPHGIQVERDRLRPDGAPPPGAPLEPTLGLPARNYG